MQGLSFMKSFLRPGFSGLHLERSSGKEALVHLQDPAAVPSEGDPWAGALEQSLQGGSQLAGAAPLHCQPNDAASAAALDGQVRVPAFTAARVALRMGTFYTDPGQFKQ